VSSVIVYLGSVFLRRLAMDIERREIETRLKLLREEMDDLSILSLPFSNWIFVAYLFSFPSVRSDSCGFENGFCRPPAPSHQ
jgi:hypothetical protein